MTVAEMKTTFVVGTSQTAVSANTFRASFNILTWGQISPKPGYFSIVLYNSILSHSFLRQSNVHQLQSPIKGYKILCMFGA